MIDKIKQYFKQLFCKHDFEWYHKPLGKGGFRIISGERHVQICSKCGKRGTERFFEYEGSGYK